MHLRISWPKAHVMKGCWAILSRNVLVWKSLCSRSQTGGTRPSSNAKEQGTPANLLESSVSVASEYTSSLSTWTLRSHAFTPTGRKLCRIATVERGPSSLPEGPFSVWCRERESSNTGYLDPLGIKRILDPQVGPKVGFAIKSIYTP